MTDPSTFRAAEPEGGAPPPSTAAAPLSVSFKVGIASIADVVFGLALSIGSLILVSKTPQSGYALVQGIYYFGFSFLTVILVWLSFRRMVLVLPYETQAILSVNIALLFCVAIEPFLFYVLVTTNAIGDDASTAFALDIGAMMFLLSGLDYLLLREERHNSPHRLPQEIVDRQGRAIILHLVFGSVFLVSALPLFWTVTVAGAPMREYLWYFGLFGVVAVQAHWGSASRPRPNASKSNSLPAFSTDGRAEAR